MGGGPLLIRDRNIVLNPQLEGFSTNFIQGVAPRTAVGKTADGTWIIATMHDRVGGRGPTLSETAQIMQQLGAVDALNLDGGSSSSLLFGWAAAQSFTSHGSKSQQWYWLIRDWRGIIYMKQSPAPRIFVILMRCLIPKDEESVEKLLY